MTREKPNTVIMASRMSLIIRREESGHFLRFENFAGG
jgi:hypothetical protein